MNDDVRPGDQPSIDRSLVERLRADLTAASFTVDALERLWGEVPARALTA